jgi:cellulose synthase/poly-beta-1,6-N-acetylglucosamine synthase-like glycosyltransferase
VAGNRKAPYIAGTCQKLRKRSPFKFGESALLTTALFATALLAVLSILVFGIGWHVARDLGRPAKSWVGSEGELPRIAVFLALRGADSELAEMLRRLFRQEYPDYTVAIVVDSDTDPAWKIVQSALQTDLSGRFHAATLKERLATCGRKNCALVQMLQELASDREVIVQIDGDVLTHRTWLLELVSPMRDARVGMTFGNRWYAPASGEWGSLIRYLWNVMSVATMKLSSTPWAGSCAIRRPLLDEIGAKQLWSRAIVDDASIRMPISRLGTEIRFVPSAMLINSESCGLYSTFVFITRQMAWTRIYIRPVWAQSMFATFAVAGLLSACAGVTVITLIVGMWPAALCCIAGFAILLAAAWAASNRMDRAVRSQARLRGESVPPLSLAASIKLLPGIPIAFALHVISMTVAHFKRNFEWRGVRYRVNGPWDVRVVEDAQDCDSTPDVQGRTP